MKRLVWIILLFPVISSAQVLQPEKLQAMLATSKPDTARVTILCKLSIVEPDGKKSIDYGQKALQLSEQLHSKDGQAKSYYVIALQYERRPDYNRAISNFAKALSLASEKKLLSKILTAMGSCHMYESHYTKALSCYHRALKIDEALGDKADISKVAMNIASVYYSIKDYRNAITYSNQAINQKIKDPEHNAVLFRNLGAIYNTMGQYDKALEYFEKSLNLFEQIKNNGAVASLLSDIALVYYDTGLYDKAVHYSKLSLGRVPPEISDKMNVAFSYGIIGDSYTEMAKKGNKRIMIDSAVTYLGKSIALHKELNNIRGLYDDYTSLSTAQKLLGDYKSAMASYETSIVYKDSIFNNDNRETIKNIEDKRQIEIRDRELKINRITLQAEERQKWLLISGIALLVVIACLLFYQNRIRKKTNLKLNRMNDDLDRANRTKTHLLSILNHDLRSPVNSFIHFIQFQKESPELLDEASKKRIENATIGSAKNLLESMEDMLLWTKDQMENFDPNPKKIAIDGVFDDLKKHFSGLKHIMLIFENTENISVVTDENYLKTILRNLISNAVKALDEMPDATVTVVAFSQNGQPFITVSDNGPGGTIGQFRALYDENEAIGAKSGLGLHLVRDLAKGIGCKIAVDTKAGEGTTFIISFP